MFFENVEFHNIEQASRVEGRNGVLLSRVQESLSVKLRKGTREVYRTPAGAEIRFVSDWEPAKVTLSSYCGESCAQLYFGNYQAQSYRITEQPTEIDIPVPQFLPHNEREGKTFSPAVRRLMLAGGEVHFLGVEGAGIRPPVADEVPGLHYLAYGTSITQGLRASNPMLTYVSQTARRLGADTLNYGANGNCFCEPELAEWLAQRGDWDFATLCLSANMLNQGVTAQEFREKAGYMVHTMAAKNPCRPVICIGLFPYYLDRGMKLADRTYRSTSAEYRQILRELVESAEMPNLYFIDGRELLRNFEGLSEDLIHPGDAGMIEIGENLAEFIRPLLIKYGITVAC
jgi:lysophospholipase L1-like esterase